MGALRPISATTEPSYPTRRAVRGLRKVALVAATSAALLLGACSGADESPGRTGGVVPMLDPDEVRLSGEAPPAQMDDPKPWKPEPVFAEPEPIRLGGVARPPEGR